MKTTANTPNSIQPLNYSLSTKEVNIDIGQYWRVIKRHKFGIFNITLVCLIIGILAALNSTPVYKAETKLVADPTQPNINTRDQYVNTALVFLFYETQYEIISSQRIAQKAVERLNLVARYKAGQLTNANKEQSTAFIQQIKDIALVKQIKGWLPISETAEPIPEPSDDVLRITLARKIQAGLKVDGGKQSQIINIGYEDSDPQLAADIVNAIADSYMEYGLESRSSGAKETSIWLNDQLSDLKSKLKASEAALQAFQKSHSMVDTTQQQQLAGTRLSTLSTELIRAQTKRSEAEIRYEQIRLKYENGDYTTLSPILNKPSVQALEQEMTKLSRSVKELSERYGEIHPKMVAARADLNQAKQNFEIEVDKVVDSIRKEYQAALTQEKEINALINKEKSDLGGIRGSSFELASLEREVLNNQKSYESFLIRYQEANISEKYDASNIQIIDIALVPKTPFKPNKPRFIMAAVVLGLFIGVLFAFLREHLNNTFKSIEDLEEKLQLPSLGVIPLVEHSRKSIKPEQQVIFDTRSPFAESVNNIRTGLLFSNIDNPPKTILVTSATAMEGKSTLATNLAASLSHLDRTLLLEVDLRKPSIAKYLGMNPIPGLSDQALNKKSILEDAITQIGGENSKLYVIPAGSFTPNPIEFLSSDAFKQLLEKLKTMYTYIVLDSPPLLAVSDAIVVGHMVDSVILAVKAESTKTQMTQESINRLRKGSVQITGTVLTQVDVKRMEAYGSHYYYDGSYYGDRRPEATKKPV